MSDLMPVSSLVESLISFRLSIGYKLWYSGTIPTTARDRSKSKSTLT